MAKNLKAVVVEVNNDLSRFPIYFVEVNDRRVALEMPLAKRETVLSVGQTVPVTAKKSTRMVRATGPHCSVQWRDDVTDHRAPVGYVYAG